MTSWLCFEQVEDCKMEEERLTIGLLQKIPESVAKLDEIGLSFVCDDHVMMTPIVKVVKAL